MLINITTMDRTDYILNRTSACTGLFFQIKYKFIKFRKKIVYNTLTAKKIFGNYVLLRSLCIICEDVLMMTLIYI